MSLLYLLVRFWSIFEGKYGVNKRFNLSGVNQLSQFNKLGLTGFYQHFFGTYAVFRSRFRRCRSQNRDQHAALFESLPGTFSDFATYRIQHQVNLCGYVLKLGSLIVDEFIHAQFMQKILVAG